MKYHLGNAADVFRSVLGRKTEILVQTKANVVTVQTVGGNAVMEEVLLKCGRDSGFAGCGEAGEPDSGALETDLVVNPSQSKIESQPPLYLLPHIFLAFLSANITFVPHNVSGLCCGGERRVVGKKVVVRKR